MMTAADEYQRVARAALSAYWYDPAGGKSERSPADHIDRMAAHVARALAADPGVRTAVEREARAEAWYQGVLTALHFATRDEDGISLHLDSIAHPNPYRQGPSDGE